MATAALFAAVAILLLATLPPRPLAIEVSDVDTSLRRRTLAGAYHIHTTRSDGAGSVSDVAAAAARAGLQFVIITDHGDGTREPEPPRYVDRVLVIDAVEISTNGGHYAALDLPAAPYPLGGAAPAVVEDVERLGGFGIAAHPDHSRPQLAWTDWDAPIDGLEWINADAEWRNESALRLGRVLFDYLFRPAPAMASVFDRPVRTLARWDNLARTHDIVALAAVDAHGGGLQSQEESGGAVVVGPGYEASFRSLTNRVLVDQPPGGEAAADAAAILAAIRAGRVYSVVDALARDVFLRFDEQRGFSAASPLPAGAEVRSIKTGDRTRLEIHLPHAPGEPPVPWVVTNWSGPRPVGEPAEPPVSGWIPLSLTSEWRVENDPASQGRIEREDGAIVLRYQLAEGSRNSQFVAVAADLAETERFEFLTFRARAESPMRLSVQLRFAPDDGRWTKSVYLDANERLVSVPMREMVPAGGRSGSMPDPFSVRSILFVVDLVNARPGTSGTVTIHDIRVGR